MFKIRSAQQVMAAVLATGCFALALGARAESTAQPSNSAACKGAQMSAWFERQRQLTDGDTNPFPVVQAPKKQELRWDFPGTQSGQ